MKKLLITTDIITILAGCNADDVQDNVNQLNDFTEPQSRKASGILYSATQETVTYIFNECTTNGSMAPTNSLCKKAKDPKAISNNVGKSDANFKIDVKDNKIEVTFDKGNEYFTYTNDGELKISYANNSSLNHHLTINVNATTPNTAKVSFDSQNENDDGSFNANASDMDYDYMTTTLKGRITVKTKYEFIFVYN